MGDESSTIRRVEPLPAVTQTARLDANGSTTVTVEPPRPCGLDGCVAEILFGVGSNLPTRIHVNARQRVQLIEGLGGEVR